MDSKKKILQVIQPLDGGSAFHVKQLLSEINKDKFELHLAAPEHPGYKKVCNQNSVRYHIIPLSRSINPLRSINPFLKLVKLIRSEKFEVVHLHSTTAGLLGRFAAIGTGARVIYTPHSPLYFQLSGAKKRIFYWAERSTGIFVDEFILVSPSEKSRVITDGMAPAKKCIVIVNGIEIPKLKHQPSDHPIITMVSRLEKQKRQQDLINAASIVLKKFPETEFRIIGEGSRYQELRKLIDELGLEQNIKLMGARSDIAKQWAESTIAVQCSETEGLPYTVLEAMSAGLPVIGTKVEGIVDLVSKETGLLYEKGDTNEMAKQIIYLIDNKAIAHKMGKNSISVIKNSFSIDLMIEKLEHLY